MANHEASRLPSITPELRRAAAGQYERANQVIATGNYDYGIQLLLSCCKLEPSNLIYRQALRRTEKTKYGNNLRGSMLAGLRNWATRAKIKNAMRTREYLKVLEYGEQVLARNPWETGTQLDMAEAADALGLLDLAIWSLEQERHKNPRDLTINRSLARLFEKRGNFTQAIALWEMIRKAAPRDLEAQNKAKDLAANETIARGHYDAVVGDREEEPGEEAPPKPGARTQESNAAEKTPLAPSSSAERGGNEVARLRARVEADPTNPNTYIHLASVYRRAGQHDQARKILAEGIGPTGNSFELMVELAEVDIEPFRSNLTITEEKL
jgi:tetratricopeptide (TPR) repeat protein